MAGCLRRWRGGRCLNDGQNERQVLHEFHLIFARVITFCLGSAGGGRLSLIGLFSYIN